MTKYCTFWYPTIFHQKLKRVDDSIIEIERDISDRDYDASVTEFTLRLRLEESEGGTWGNLIVTLISEGNILLSVVLICTKIRRNGFVQYSYDDNLIPEQRRDIFEAILKKDIYHLAKDFYHEHEADSGKDAGLKAFIGLNPEPIDQDDSKVLEHFLRSYTNVFMNYAHSISDSNSFVRQCEVSLEEIKRSGVQDARLDDIEREIRDETLVINRRCENALIEYTYCKTLLSSRYNKSFHPSIPTDTTKDEWRQQALNIRNSIRYIENIKYKNQNRLNNILLQLLGKVQAIAIELQANTATLQNTTLQIENSLKQSRKTEKINTSLAWLSIFLAVFGLAACFVVGNKESVWFCIWAGTISVGIFYFIIRLVRLSL